MSEENCARTAHKGVMMKIGLIDVDGHNFPNLPLMKISAHHKAQGDDVEWCIPLLHYDVIYKSKVFDDTYTNDAYDVLDADKIIKGGTGYDLHNKLPDEIEHIYPDYSLYGITDEAYGFLTRGCPRGCPFCIVAEKEGKASKQVAELNEFWRGQKNIKLLDPNITASKECEKLFDELIESKAKIDFTQGLDARVITDKAVWQINHMKVDILHFAWDNYEMKTYEKLKRIRPLLKMNHRKLAVYVLTNFNTTHEQDLERVMKLKELDYDPYVMIYDKPNAPKITKQLQRYVNNRFIFRSCEWEDYKP